VRRCRLRHDQFADVGGQVLVDDEACVRLIQLDASDVQAFAVTIIEAAHSDLLPAYKIAFTQGVQGVQLVDPGVAGDAQCQRLGALELYIEVTAEQAAAQFQANEGAEVGLRQAQVDVLGGDLELGSGRAQLHLPGCLQFALLAQTAVEPEVERLVTKAVEILQIEVQR